MCQKAHWKGGHRPVCRRLSSAVPATAHKHKKKKKKDKKEGELPELEACQ